jgi:cobalamin biosynthesis protein CobW
VNTRIPATVVTGFLGAGKTTLIRNLIRQARGRRIAVVVNEFGDMGFDGALIGDCGDDDCRPDSVVELTNGCICCTVADEFLPTMAMLIARDPAPDHIVIETSGLALPQPLVQAFNWPAVRHRVTVDGVVAVVDAEAVAEGRLMPVADLAADPGRTHDDPVEELFEDQLRCADLVVIAKADRVSASGLDRVEAVVARETRAGVSALRSTADGLPGAVLLGLSAAAEADLAGRESHHEIAGEDHDHDDFESFVAAPAPYASLAALRERVGAALRLNGVLRIKGHARVAGRAAPVAVQGVGTRVEAYFASAQAAAGLVVIGLRGLDRNAVVSALSE